MNIDLLMQKLDELNEGFLDLPLEDEQALMDAINGKIDGYKEIIDFIEAREEQAYARADAWKKEGEVLGNKKRRLRDFLIFAMQKHNTPLLLGKEWQVRLSKRKKVEVFGKPDSNAFIKHPELVDVGYRWIAKDPDAKVYAELLDKNLEKLAEMSFDWNKKKLEEVLKSDVDSELAAIGKIVETPYVTFKVAREKSI